MRVRWLAAWVCKSAGLGAELLLDGGTRAGRGYVGFVAVVVPPDTGKHTQMTDGSAQGRWRARGRRKCLEP